MCGLGLVAMYVQRNPQESMHKPHEYAVAQVIHWIILIALIIRLTHVRIRLSAILSVEQEAASQHLFSDSPHVHVPDNENSWSRDALVFINTYNMINSI